MSTSPGPVYGYVFAGYPRNGLNAGGLEYCIEEVEQLAMLEHDPAFQLRKEGLFILSPSGAAEQIADVRLNLSDRVNQDGITQDWFRDNACFGNGVGVSKTLAHYQTKIVNHHCGRTPGEIMQAGEVLDYANLRLKQVHDFNESWGQYERRWRSGTCPQENHILQLTSVVTKHELPSFAYRRLVSMIEDGEAPLHPELYISPEEPGRYRSEAIIWDGLTGYQE